MAEAAEIARRDGQIGGICVLCWIGFGGTGRATTHHHIRPKGMGGREDEFDDDLRNLAPTCTKCHRRFQPARAVWVKAMAAAFGYNYKGTPLEWHIE